MGDVKGKGASGNARKSRKVYYQRMLQDALAQLGYDPAARMLELFKHVRPEKELDCIIALSKHLWTVDAPGEASNGQQTLKIEIVQEPVLKNGADKSEAAPTTLV